MDPGFPRQESTSRMSTACSLSYRGGGREDICPGGGSLSKESLSGEVSVQGGLCLRGLCLGGYLLGRPPRQTPPSKGHGTRHRAPCPEGIRDRRQRPPYRDPPSGQTDTYENITLPQTSFAAVKMERGDYPIRH